MALYKYNSFNRRGELIKGSIDATSKNDAKELLKGQGLMPTSIVDAGMSTSFSFSSLFEKKVELKTILIFTKQLSVLLKSGVPLLQAIELMIEQFEGLFKRILISMKDGIKSGESFAGELSRYPKVFSNVYIQLVRAGEASGKLEGILMRLTEYLERSEDIRKRIKKAMSYPLTMISFALLVVSGLLAFLVPRLTSMFAQTGKELPLPTKILQVASDFFVNHFILLSISIVAVVTSFIYWKSTPSGRLKFDELLLRFPLTAYFSRTNAVVQFCKTLGMLIESGVNLSEALDIVSNIVENSVLVNKLKKARDSIIKEGKIAKYLKQTGIFPSIASYMIRTGEESGKLGEMLTSVGDDYGIELMELTDSLTEKIGPIMTVFLGALVGFIVMAIFLPIMSMGDIAGV